VITTTKFAWNTTAAAALTATRHSRNSAEKSTQVIFIAPKNGAQEIQLNFLSEHLFQTNRVAHGWYVETYKEHTFHLHLLTSNSATIKTPKANNIIDNNNNNDRSATTIIRKFRDESKDRVRDQDSVVQQQQQQHSFPMQFYLYFTLNPYSCDDYLNHTHIPIVLTQQNEKKIGLFKTEITISLSASNVPHYICLSDLFAELPLGNSTFNKKYFFIFFLIFYLKINSFKRIHNKNKLSFQI
jgi:hypothetical protein